MSRLPNMKYLGNSQRGQNIVFKGLNLSDTAGEGELIDCTNLSAKRFPRLSARGGRTKKGDYKNATAAFMWNGHEIVAEGGKLLYDGVALCNCTPGSKQFAVINTKLVVWPDKLVIDMINRSFRKLDLVATNIGEVKIKSNSISFVPRSVYSSLSHEAVGTVKNGFYLPWMWTYERVEWNNEERKWVLEGKKLSSMKDCLARYYIPNVTLNDITGEYIIDLPTTEFPKNYEGDVTEEELPEPKGNNLGFYCKITNVTLMMYSSVQVRCTQLINVFRSGGSNISIKDNFNVGDFVSVKGSLYGLVSGENLEVKAVDGSTNTLEFKEKSLRPIKYIYEIPEDVPLDPEDKSFAEMYLKIEDDEVLIVHISKSEGGWKKGDVVCVETDESSIRDAVEMDENLYSVYVWNSEKLMPDTTRGSMWIHYDEEYEEDEIVIEDLPQMTEYDAGGLSVQRIAYDFDFICEKDNRLWGVCNKQKNANDGACGRLIAASALGDPTSFNKFDGLSTDSWQVAVAGDGDFTACCNYGDCVLFFKEDKVYKVAGDLPEQYTLYPYNIAGVQKGSHKSLVNINETLFYKGVNGVYAYGGGAPGLVSSALGRNKYYDAVAGSDGIVYYISMRNDGGYHLFTYDTLTGIWLREDDTEAADFCFSSGDLLMLTGGKLYLINGEADTDDGTPIKWSAELASFNEATDHNRRSYSRLLLRTSMKNLKTDSVSVYVSNTSGRWDPCTKKNLSVGDYVIPLKPNRDNDLRIKIEGKSPDMVLSLAREYIGGSELGGVK